MKPKTMYQFLKLSLTIILLTNCTAFSYSQSRAAFSLDDTTLIIKDIDGNIMSKDSITSFMSRGSFSYKKNELGNGKTELILFRKTQEENERETQLTIEKMNKWINLPFPDFDIINPSGASIKNEDLKGKITLVNFWFTGCQPCIQEMPALNKLVKKYGGSVNFIAFTFNETSEVKSFLKDHDFNYMQLPGAQQLVKTLDISSYPTHMLLDKEGNIKKIEIGATENIAEKLTGLIENALK